MKTEQTEILTIIDNRQDLSCIDNFDILPLRVRREIKKACIIRSYGFQELCGYDDARQMIFSAGGCWNGDRFTVISYGSHCYQWDGERLSAAIRVYV